MKLEYRDGFVRVTYGNCTVIAQRTRECILDAIEWLLEGV